MKEFTIDRSKWIRGDVFDDPSVLRDDEGRMCCLGFYAKACGAKVKDLLFVGVPSELGDDLPTKAKWLVEGDDPLNARQMDFVQANDKDGIDERARERKIKELFAEQGIKVKFVGRTPPRRRR